MVHPIDSQLVFNSVLGGLVPLGVTGGLMEHSFSGKIPFNSNDTENLLNPRFVFVGAHWVDKDGNFVNKMPDFYNRGVWELGWGREKEKLNGYIDEIKRGDVLVVKKLNGKAQDTMKIIAIGVVVGFPQVHNEARTVLYVAWTMPNVDLDVPLQLVGTINKPKYAKDFRAEVSRTFNEIGNDEAVKQKSLLVSLIDRCVARFITQNLQPISHTLYQY